MDDIVNVVVEENTVLPVPQRHSATDLILTSGQKYIATVRGYNTIGFGVTLSSDGIVLDKDPPIAGVVYNGGRANHIYWQSSTSVVKAHWFAFDDHDTYIRKYEWAIGVPRDIESIQAFTDVIIQTTAEAEGVSLELGVKYVHSVRAWDAAGFSITASSEPFQVDDTAPIAVECPTSDEPYMMIVEDAQFDGSQWNTSKAVLSDSEAVDATVHMRGEISQELALLQHRIYKFEMHTSAPCISNNSRIKIDYAEVLLDLIPTLEGDCEFYYSFVSQRATSRAVISIYSLEGLSIKDITLSQCSVDPVESTNPIVLQMIGATDVEVQWYIDDRESRINYYELGLGTTPGGVQLMLYRNHGLQNTFYAYNLHVSHAVSVYATVIATNRAGLVTRFISAAAIVDWTPPYVPLPIVTVFSMGESQYIVMATWLEVNDPESDVDGCSWGIGMFHISTLV